MYHQNQKDELKKNRKRKKKKYFVLNIKIGSVVNQTFHNFFKTIVSSNMKRGISILEQKRKLLKKLNQSNLIHKILITPTNNKHKKKKHFQREERTSSWKLTLRFCFVWRISFTSWCSPFSIASKRFSSEYSAILNQFSFFLSFLFLFLVFLKRKKGKR